MNEATKTLEDSENIKLIADKYLQYEKEEQRLQQELLLKKQDVETLKVNLRHQQ